MALCTRLDIVRNGMGLVDDDGCGVVVGGFGLVMNAPSASRFVAENSKC